MHWHLRGGVGKQFELQQQILKVAPSYERVLGEFIQYAIELRDSGRPSLQPRGPSRSLLVFRPARATGVPLMPDSGLEWDVE